MSNFEKHFRMTEADAIEYARHRLPEFRGSKNVSCTEIGDGNINYIFRIADSDTGRSVVIKHADERTRSSGRPLGTDRNRIEAEILRLEREYAPGLVPEIYDYDPVMRCLIMEDLSDHRILRYELLAHRMFPRLAEDITDFVVSTTLPTLDVVLQPSRKKELVQCYTNPPLCDITERLVFTNPYINAAGDNKVFPPNLAFVEKELYENSKLHLEVAKLKYGFMNNSQALIHGDLHSGSIFVKPSSTKIIDPEFAFFGPIGYDLGNVIGNLCFAWANALATMESGGQRDQYIGWVETTIAGLVDLFNAKFASRFPGMVTDRIASTKGYREWFLAGILEDTAGTAGLEMIRRTVGVAQVKDLTSIVDSRSRVFAERLVILAAKSFILGRKDYGEGEFYVHTLRKVLSQLQL